MTRTEIIQHYIDKIGAKRYLEIGIEHAVNFKAIRCEHKVGVDPASPHATYQVTSDAYFEKCGEVFDVIFIDGLHHADQVYRDYQNAVAHLAEGGVIVFHDCMPSSELAQIVPRQTGIWNGDCWKAWVQIRSEVDDREMFVVSEDHGCGVSKPGKNEKIALPPLTWQSYQADRDNLLNLISMEEWKRREGIN